MFLNISKNNYIRACEVSLIYTSLIGVRIKIHLNKVAWQCRAPKIESVIQCCIRRNYHIRKWLRQCKFFTLSCPKVDPITYSLGKKDTI